MASNVIGNTWTLTKTRVRLVMHKRTFLFFSLSMALGCLFFFVTIFSKGDTAWTAYILGSILTMTVMGSFWGLSVQLVMFREAGILRRFRLAPLGAGPMLASSILANYILVIPSVAIEILVTKLFLHMRRWGNLWAIFLPIAIGSATFSAFGRSVASVTNTMQETQVINQVIWTAFLFLSGATVPLARFPHWIQGASLFMPATYLATGLEDAATNLSTHREIITDLIALTLGVLVAFEISRQLFRWEPEAKLPGSAKLWVLAAMIPVIAFGAYENVKGDRLALVRQNFQMLNSASMASPPKSR